MQRRRLPVPGASGARPPPNTWTAHERASTRRGPRRLLLGAGKGTRFNAAGTKLLAPLRGRPLLAHVVTHVRVTGLPMRLVLDSTAPQPLVDLADQLTREGEIVQNPLAARGIGTSIAAGMHATKQATGWLVLPADMPNIGSDVITLVAQALEDPRIMSARPVYRGTPGYPLGFSRRCNIDWNTSLIAMGLTLLKAKAAGRALFVETPGVVQDVDQPSDLAALEGPDDTTRNSYPEESTWHTGSPSLPGAR
ncbi:nucleotidyltransferase family protein [Verminephrobacter eiseniae]|uniref:nucleotidyltransferase family protein n=1 Tax=Verminephrobacter eiseniae TaxID=364317 RepID=UPI0000DCC9B2|nr:NTP transferase domain-containing protein [Verminephrobacter eiseniae]MCW5284409.1 hypothetical protein [Verminephrobacter eiseniae]MCW5302115.1 hypothetical protein [Verminephrobacter eiseniae]MCW8179183.1 hypothetical protein [Verminephrobacter eiseniae]MCW8192011.1 hypothetical protein [Verminephrobacter eiseniae]